MIFAPNLSMARITFTTMYDTTMRNLQHNLGKLNTLDEQIASQKKINRPSDNPVGFTNSLKYTNILSALGQQQLTMKDGEVYMTVLENTHNSMNKLFGRCQELAVQAANDTEQHEQRLFTNLEVRQLLEQLVANAQTKHKDGYIFSGKWTNQPPYEIKKGEAIYYDGYKSRNTPPPPVPTASANPGYVGPPDPVFDPDEKIVIQLYDGRYEDPNLIEIPNNPLVQRIIPGSVSGLTGLQEKSHVIPPDDPSVVADYEIDYINGTITLLSENAKAAFFNNDPSNAPGSPTFDPELPIFGELKPTNLRPNMQFEYIYRNSIDMTGEIYREIDTGITMKINSNRDALFGKGGENQTDSFKEIISLMQGLWYNDQPQISKSIDNVDVARKRNLAEQAVEGARLNRVALTFDRNEDLTITNTGARSDIEDVDFVEALSQFSLAEAVYNASLYATSKLMQQSLMNFL
jgi:flagellin-like hook-associated protein FlgL